MISSRRNNVAPPSSSADSNTALAAGGEESLTESSEKWIFQTGSGWARRVWEALTQPWLIHCCLGSLWGTSQASAKAHTKHGTPANPVLDQSWGVRVKKKRAAGMGDAVTSHTGLTEKQRHCTRLDWAVWPDWMWETESCLLPGSISGVPPSHLSPALSRNPLWVCSSGLKFAFFEALGTFQGFCSPISHCLENKASEAQPKVRRSIVFKVFSSAGVKYSIKFHWKHDTSPKLFPWPELTSEQTRGQNPQALTEGLGKSTRFCPTRKPGLSTADNKDQKIHDHKFHVWEKEARQFSGGFSNPLVFCPVI